MMEPANVTDDVRSLLDLPHRAARALAASGAPVYVSVNPLEYHGPHLSLRNDALLAEGATSDLHARLQEHHPDWPLLRGPTLEAGVGTAPGPGSKETPYGVLRRLVVAACRAVCDLGAKRVVLMTFHGHPLHSLALQAGVAHCTARGVPALGPMSLLVREQADFDPDDVSRRARIAPALAHLPEPQREELLRGLAQDFHAGFFETSLSLHWAPQSVDPAYRDLPACPTVRPARWVTWLARLAGRGELARELRLAANGLGWLRLSPSPGYTGQPALATAQAGAVFARAIIDQWAHAATEVLDGRAPPLRPIMGWLPAVTLGGRLL
jgi:creatinine amidohydrolase